MVSGWALNTGEGVRNDNGGKGIMSGYWTRYGMGSIINDAVLYGSALSV